MAVAGIGMMIISIATKIYTDPHGQGLTIYRPDCPPGYCMLGDYAQEGDISKPNPSVMVCIKIKHTKFFAKAKDFVQVWSSEGPGSGRGYSGDSDDEGSSDGNNGSGSGHSGVLAFWKPKVPNLNYVALGHLATTSYDPPSVGNVCIVHRLMVDQGIPGRRVWREESGMASLWSLAPSYSYINLGLFLSSDSKSAPHISDFWSLIPEVIPAPFNASLSIKKLNKDELALIYRGQECEESKRLSVYLPQAPIGYSPLGHYAERGYGRAGQGAKVLVVKEKGNKGLLMHPITYQELWRSDAKNNNTEAAVWRPVPPPGYFCLGHVLGLGLEAPPTNAIVCLHWSVIARGWPERSKKVWWNTCSQKKEATIWQVPGLGDCLSADTFVIHRGFNSPHWEELLFHCFYLNRVSVR